MQALRCNDPCPLSYVRLDRLNWRFRRSALDANLDRLTVKAKEVYA